MLRQLPDRNSNYPIASDCPTQLPDRNDCPAQLPDLGAANYLISISRLRSVGRQPPQPERLGAAAAARLGWHSLSWAHRTRRVHVEYTCNDGCAIEWRGRHTHFSLRGRDAALGLGGDEEAPRHDADPADPAALLAISGDETPPFAPPGAGALADPARARLAALPPPHYTRCLLTANQQPARLCVCATRV
jgi:hypothetical protein